jgi:hypothetical protein
VAADAISQCEQSEQRIETAAYSVCFPKTWAATKNDSANIAGGCSKKHGRCEGTGGGFPLRGVVTVGIGFAENIPGRVPPRSIEDIIGAEAKYNNPTIAAVSLGQDGAHRKCIVLRTFMAPAPLWYEVYAMDVDSKLFRVIAQYQDEPAKIEKYRTEITRILSSITLRSPKAGAGAP